MAAVDDLASAYDNIAAILKSITANPKPTYVIDGETVNWTEYFQALTSQLLVLEQARQRAAGPFEFRTQGVS